MNTEHQFDINSETLAENDGGGFLHRIKDFVLSIPSKLIAFSRLRKVRIVFVIETITIFIIALLNVFKPEAQKREIPETVVRVDVIQASLSSYPIVVNANGTIEAETRGNLVAQIRGEVVSMSDNFKTGGSFNKGDVLIQIDPRDYQASLSQAVASLSQADANYRQEKANAKQAVEDWKRLGNQEQAPELVQRKPQLSAAKAQLDSARAAHQTAKLNLSRTTITAPYTGRVIRRDAVLGQYVGVGTPIAEVFSTDGVEVRLPISQDEFSQLGLDQFGTSNNTLEFRVTLSSTIGNTEHNWDALVTRTDSTFDINTRQIDVIAKVEDPFGKQSGQVPLKIGQFVSASIQGRSVDNVYVIPNKSIREGSYTYVARDDHLVKQSIDILWQDDQNTLVAQKTAGLVDGDLVVVTSLNSTLAGARVKLADDVVAKNQAKKEPQKAATKQPVIGSQQKTDSKASVQ
jgi:RND family efflux transporter MFP subunit